MAESEARFGAGEPHCFGHGACGDLWQTTWKVEADELAADEYATKWQAMAAFVSEHGDAAPIYWSWSDRKDDKPSGAALQLVLRFEPVFTAVGGDEALPLPLVEGDGESTIIAFLGRTSSAILDIWTPFSEVDADFAAWEQAFCKALGVDLSASRWDLEFFSDKGWEGGHKHEQGRYRRFDWTPEGLASAAPKGPWDKPLKALLAPRVKQDDEFDLHDVLKKHPLGPVTFGLVQRMCALKGAPLERGRFFLQQLIDENEDRAAMAPALIWLLDNPPPSKQLRTLAWAWARAAGDVWFLDIVEPLMAQKKVPTPVWQFLEELVIHFDDADNPDRRAALCVTGLRLLREKGTVGRRGTFANCLASCDDGSAWATVLLEAATVGKGWEDWRSSWAWTVLQRWESRERVSDPRAQQWMARVPEVPLGFHSEPDDVTTEVPLTDDERAQLLALEAAYLRMG